MLKQAHERTHDEGFFANDTHVLVHFTCVVELQLSRLCREKYMERFLRFLDSSKDSARVMPADTDSRGVWLRQTHGLRQDRW